MPTYPGFRTAGGKLDPLTTHTIVQRPHSLHFKRKTTESIVKSQARQTVCQAVDDFRVSKNV